MATTKTTKATPKAKAPAKAAKAKASSTKAVESKPVEAPKVDPVAALQAQFDAGGDVVDPRWLPHVRIVPGEVNPRPVGELPALRIAQAHGPIGTTPARHLYKPNSRTKLGFGRQYHNLLARGEVTFAQVGRAQVWSITEQGIATLAAADGKPAPKASKPRKARSAKAAPKAKAASK